MCIRDRPTEEQPPVVAPEEPNAGPEEPPVEPEPPVEEPQVPPTPEPEPQNPIEESSPEVTTPKEAVTSAVNNVLADGKLTAADSDKVMEALNADGEVTKEEVNALVDALKEDGKLSEAEKDLVAEALVASVAPGDTLTKEQIQDAGIEYKDLPPATPVEVRQDENGNEVIITADVAAALVLLESPSELVGAIFSDPGQALQALGSIGADMSPQEREEAQKMVVAAVIAGNAAINAVAVAGSAAGGPASGGSRSGGTGGGSSGGGGASGESKGYRRRKP
jgi:hypothetical protein